MSAIKKIGPKGYLTVWHRQLKNYGLTCIKCKQVTAFHAFDLDRVNAGEKYNANNVQLICGTCNSFRGNKDAVAFYGNDFDTVNASLSDMPTDTELQYTANELRHMHKAYFTDIHGVESQVIRELNKVAKYR